MIYGKSLIAQQFAIVGFLYKENSNPTSLTIELLKNKKSTQFKPQLSHHWSYDIDNNI